MLSMSSTSGPKVTHPRASLPALPSSVLARVVQLAAPLTDDDEFDTAHWLAGLHRIACTCRALYLAAHMQRCRHVVLRAPTSLDDTPSFPAYLRIDAQDRPLDLSNLSLHIGRATVSLRLYLDPTTSVDLSALGSAAHLRRLTVSNGKLRAANVPPLPTNLVELELLDVKCPPALADSLIRRNPLLETVHLTPIIGDDRLYMPGAALAALEHLEYLQYTPPSRFDADEPSHASLLVPFAARLVEPLVLVHAVEESLPDLLVDSVERMVIYYSFEGDEPEVGSGLPDQLVCLAKWVSSASRLKEVAFPGAWHPDRDLDDPSERGIQFAVNSVINACVERRARVAFYDPDAGGRPRGASVAPLRDELRTGLSSEPAIVRLGQPLAEWPGSWALILADDASDEPWA